MQLRIRLTNGSRKSLVDQLQQAYTGGHLRLVKRIHALLWFVDGKSVAEASGLLHLGEQTVRDYIGAFILKGVSSLSYQRPSGRPPKLTQTQRKELADLITAGPEASGYASGYASGCWTAIVIQDLIHCRFGVEYHPQYICSLLDNMGFSFQKARFMSDHLDEAARLHWLQKTWPEILCTGKEKKAMILFGDEVSFAQWGSLSYTWALKGQQPTVKTSGKRKAYKVFGLIDHLSGRFFWKGQTGRFNGESYAAFLLDVLAQTKQHLVLIQDGAKYHTSRLMTEFFAAHTDRLTRYQLPSYSPDFNPIEFLWKKVKKQATHLKYFPEFAALIQKVDGALHHFANTPDEITSLMGLYCKLPGAVS
jgi:transposase